MKKYVVRLAFGPLRRRAASASSARGSTGLRVAMGLAACAALAGCGGAPSESDMRAALDRRVAAQVKGAECYLGKSVAGLAPEIKQFKKIGCKEVGENAYLCDVEVEVSQLGTTNKAATSMRFVKASDGWALAN